MTLCDAAWCSRSRWKKERPGRHHHPSGIARNPSPTSQSEVAQSGFLQEGREKKSVCLCVCLSVCLSVSQHALQQQSAQGHLGYTSLFHPIKVKSHIPALLNWWNRKKGMLLYTKQRLHKYCPTPLLHHTSNPSQWRDYLFKQHPQIFQIWTKNAIYLKCTLIR